MDVYITGKQVIPCAKLLEALTTAGLLDPRCTWSEHGDIIKLHVPNDPTTRRAFETKGFSIQIPGSA